MPPSNGTITPIMAMMNEAKPVFFSSSRSVSMPALNIRMITPSSAAFTRKSVSPTQLRQLGPTSTPAISAPTTCGM